MILSCDDGCASDVRVAELCSKYNVECVFYIPVEWRSLAYDKGYEPLTYLELKQIADDFEVGAHSLTHRHLTTLSKDDMLTEIVESKDMLEDLLGVCVTKFCPPRGYVNDDAMEIINKYYESCRLTRGEGLVHIHPNSGANNNMHWLGYVEHIGLENVKECWMHSHELDKYPEEWANLDRFLKEHSLGN